MMKIPDDKKEYIEKIEKLLLSDDIETIRQGIQIVETLDEPEIFAYFLDGIEYPNEKLSFVVESKVWKKFLKREAGRDKKVYLNTIILGLLNIAPDNVQVPLVQKRNSIEKFDFNIVLEIIGELNFPNLKEIVLYDNKLKNLEPLKKLNVVRLYINSAPDLTDMTGINGFADIESLELLGASSLNSLRLDDTLAKLNMINIHNCKMLDSIVINNGSLKELDISGVKRMKTLDLSACKSLQKINLSNCDGLTDIHGLENKNLSMLSINRCQHLSTISNIDKIGLVKEGKISYCKKMDKASFEHLKNVSIIE
jgi:hypothetical protein